MWLFDKLASPMVVTMVPDRYLSKIAIAEKGSDKVMKKHTKKKHEKSKDTTCNYPTKLFLFLVKGGNNIPESLIISEYKKA